MPVPAEMLGVRRTFLFGLIFSYYLSSKVNSSGMHGFSGGSMVFLITSELLCVICSYGSTTPSKSEFDLALALAEFLLEVL